jgi:hypothetical protein
VNKSKTEGDIHITFYLCRNHCRTFFKAEKTRDPQPPAPQIRKSKTDRSNSWRREEEELDLETRSKRASELQRQGQTLDQAALVGTLDPEHLNSQGPSTLRRMKLEDRSYFHPRKRSLLRTLVRKTIKALLEMVGLLMGFVLVILVSSLLQSIFFIVFLILMVVILLVIVVFSLLQLTTIPYHFLNFDDLVVLLIVVIFSLLQPTIVVIVFLSL